MKKGIVALMIISCIALGAATVYLRISEDRNAPEIQFEDQEITFVQGEDYTKLLEGVTAVDDRDGDVTQSLVVESVYPNDDGETATVVYAARDAANNIGKSNKIVQYQRNTEETESEPIATPIPTPSPTPVEEKKKEEILSEEHPHIELAQKNLTIDKGNSINRIAYVKSITDDKDEKDDLWQRIQITGDTLDVNTAGTYELIYYVVDSDGNKSNEETLTITVR